jgi:hypothetical protein
MFVMSDLIELQDLESDGNGRAIVSWFIMMVKGRHSSLRSPALSQIRKGQSLESATPSTLSTRCLEMSWMPQLFAALSLVSTQVFPYFSCSCVGSLQDFVPRFVVAAAGGRVSGYLAVFFPFRVCICSFCSFYSDLACCVAFLHVKFVLPDSESELAVAISACQRLVSILDLYRLPMSSVASSVAWRL